MAGADPVGSQNGFGGGETFPMGRDVVVDLERRKADPGRAQKVCTVDLVPGIIGGLRKPGGGFCGDGGQVAPAHPGQMPERIVMGHLPPVSPGDLACIDMAKEAEIEGPPGEGLPEWQDFGQDHVVAVKKQHMICLDGVKAMVPGRAGTGGDILPDDRGRLAGDGVVGAIIHHDDLVENPQPSHLGQKPVEGGAVITHGNDQTQAHERIRRRKGAGR